MGEANTHPAYMSTPMIKGELVELLRVLPPDKKWTKSQRLKDYVAFTLDRFPASTTDAGERRALELARHLSGWERR